jgi:hypothetical protein
MIAKENQAENAQQSEAIVWFMADGDGIGEHLQSLAQRDGEKEALQNFSQSMRSWAAGLYDRVPAVMEKQAMVVYAGGDDLFGALHETVPGADDLTTDNLWRWLQQFPAIWQQCGQQNLTVSMGLVWADAKVPQREALQHARDAEASAKARGKNRFALRLLYASTWSGPAPGTGWSPSCTPTPTAKAAASTPPATSPATSPVTAAPAMAAPPAGATSPKTCSGSKVAKPLPSGPNSLPLQQRGRHPKARPPMPPPWPSGPPTSPVAFCPSKPLGH